jgi:dihydrodipicolinate reductase
MWKGQLKSCISPLHREEETRMAKAKVLMTGATGSIASRILPAVRERYDLALVNVTRRNRQGEDSSAGSGGGRQGVQRPIDHCRAI